MVYGSLFVVVPYLFLSQFTYSLRVHLLPKSTTFVHSKYVMIDGELASVSSVNWSSNSFINNREAGILIGGAGASKALDFLTSVFEEDWSNGDLFTPTSTYSAADMKIITSTATRKVTVPSGPTNRSYVTPKPKAVSGTVANFTVVTSPDYSYSAVMDMINAAQESVEIYIYQITDPRICDAVEALHKKPEINVTLLVSTAIYSSYDQVSAYCFQRLARVAFTSELLFSFRRPGIGHAVLQPVARRGCHCEHGIPIRQLYVRLAMRHVQYNSVVHLIVAPRMVRVTRYCHNKFWIVDGKVLGLSTGNMSPSDLPGKFSFNRGNNPETFVNSHPIGPTGPPMSFPTFAAGGSKWRDTNRDFHVFVEDPDVVVRIHLCTLWQTALKKYP